MRAKEKIKSLPASYFVLFFFVFPDQRDMFALLISSSCFLPPLLFAISTSRWREEEEEEEEESGEMRICIHELLIAKGGN